MIDERDFVERATAIRKIFGQAGPVKYATVDIEIKKLRRQMLDEINDNRRAGV